MKSRGMLFSPAMSKAIAAGTKTQTRRIISDDPPAFGSLDAPFQPGDTILVRETFYALGHWEPVPNKLTKGGRVKWRFVEDSDLYLFSPPTEFRKGRHHKDPATVAWHKRLARFMPNSAVRYRLRVTDVRVQRLQDITSADAEAEGVEKLGPFRWKKYGEVQGFTRAHEDHINPVASYASLWESINGHGSWDLNPYVWAYTFSVLPPDRDSSGGKA